MEFRTALQPLNSHGLVDHSKPLFMLGSCFTDSIGERLESEMFDVIRNPFGTVYNPASMNSQIEFIVDEKKLGPDGIISANGLCHSFLTHSSLSAATQEELQENIHTRSALALDFLKCAKVAVLTFGTAWVYKYRKTGEIVSNCHKLPANQFSREMSSVAGAASYIDNCITLLRSVAPELKVILTVSPIRHLADGLHGNQLSKATLLLAAELIASKRENVIYFPAYEALMDDLRDYRFYDADMKHPSAVAVDYIYMLFVESFFRPDTKAAAKAARKLSALVGHRLLSVTDDAKTKFKEQIIQTAERLKAQYPELSSVVDNKIKRYEIFS